MNIEAKAKRFAIRAHMGQVRKTEKDKPMIIHPINVGNILKEYGFDSNVIAAGYLHDVVEDTKYTKEDILKRFGEDICLLVMGDSENKSLSWEDRKKETIDTIKDLDIRHKAIVCADKISNLEDLINLSEIKGKYDYSSFNRGYESQKWYYESIYESLISNNCNHPMFDRLKGLLDHIFENKDNYIKDVIYKDNNDYDKLNIIHYKGKELKKLNSVIENKKTYVIEFTGTPRTGKTTLINNLYDYFKKLGFSVNIVEEFTTSKYYKKNIEPSFKDKTKSYINHEIPNYVYRDLIKNIKSKNDILIIDRSLTDRMIWMDRLYNKDGVSKLEYNKFINYYLPIIKDNIDIVIGLYADSLTALKRDYMGSLSLAKRKFLNIDNIEEYNNSLNNLDKYKENINLNKFDTTNKSEREISILVVNKILDDMKIKYMNEINKEYSNIDI